ncbi:hypothetical protein EE612_007205, partial [Oryza sativa]
ERAVNLEIRHDAGDGARGGGDGDDEAADAEHLQAHPPCAPPWHLLLHHVHLHGEVDGERPESERADEADHVVEEGQQHGHHRGGDDERRAPRRPEQVHPAPPRRRREAELHLPGDVRRLRPPLRRPLLDEGEERLAEHLVGADEVDDDGGVGDVEEPEGLVEAEPGEEVPRRVVAERRVPHAAAEHVEHRGHRHAHHRGALHHRRLRRRRRPDGVLDLDEDQRVGVGERDVAERLQAPPHLVHRRHHADADPGQASLQPSVRDDLDDAEAEADDGVGEGHDGGEHGEPGDLIEVGDLREEDLGDAEDDHVGHAGDVARVAVPLPVEAVGPPDRQHADGRRDGVADGDADDVGVLQEPADLHLEPAQVGVHGVHVGVVPLAGDGVAGAVAIGEEG